MGYGVWGIGYGVWGMGYGVWGMGYGETRNETFPMLSPCEKKLKKVFDVLV